MAKYRIFLNTGASAWVDVEADDVEEAIDQAYELAPDVCAQCSGWGRDTGLELGDWEADYDAYEVDGEFVDTTRAASA